MFPELNRELLIKVTDHAICAENWDQDVWISKNPETLCGTSMCVAGFTAIDFGGWQPVWDEDGQATTVTKDGQTRLVFDVARDMLGITRREQDILFYGGNTADDLIRSRDVILAGHFR